MEQLFEVARRFIYNPSSCYIFSKELGGEFLKSLEIIENSLKLKDEEKSTFDIDVKLFVYCLDNITGIMYERFLSIELKDFILAYVILVENLNADFIKDSMIQQKCQYLRRISSDTSPLMEKMNLLDETSARLLAELNSLNIPGFKISDHYFNLIKEEN